MATQQDVFQAIQNIKNAILNKGGTIPQANTNVSLPELVSGVNSIPSGGASYKIQTAEMANTTIELYSESGSLVESKSTGANGGLVEFEVADAGIYTIKALKDGVELWTNSITLEEIGLYNCKSGKAFNDYTWDEIKVIGDGGYPQYMFSVGDIKKVASFMGQTSDTYTNVKILGFFHDDLADGSGKAPYTFMIPQTSSTYKHWGSNVNGVSWVGSLIRQSCLKSGESYYAYDSTITSSSEGTYYKLGEDGESFVEVTLPADFVSGEIYYTKTTLGADGAFIAGLPSEIASMIKQVKKKTWRGRPGTVTTADDTIITTKDWLFLPADCEVFGTKDRYVTYSKYQLEGEQYNYFKEYAENKLRLAGSQWLRSPNPSSTTYFALWSNNGYANNNASNAYRVALCFCI